MININYSQLFLLTYLIVIVAYHILTYGRIESKHEKLISEKYGRTTLGKIFVICFNLVLLIWLILVVAYFFIYDIVNWFWKISLLDTDIVKIIAITIMCFAFLLNIIFSISVGQSIKNGVVSGKESQLITTGLYRYIRHPAYTAVILSILGTFLIIPNVLTLFFLLCTIIIMYGHSQEEEKILIKIYGREYEEYKKRAGRFLPK